jgi:thiol-disulfide isomerase/thioredoxin
MDMSITGGNMVRDGAAITYKHTFSYVVGKAAPDPKALEFAPGDRQRVDVIASLVKPKEGEAGPENGAAPDGAGGDLVGRPAPDFVLATLDGKAVDLEDYRGRVVVLDFWATWCGPCRAALPALHEVAAWAKDAQLPVTVLTINVFERAENPDAVLKTVREFWQSAKHTLPVALDFTGQIAGAYGVNGIPASFIIRSDGVVHAQHVGAAPVAVLKDEITEALKALEN